MKKFKGYYCVGCNTRQDAIDGKGLILWSQKSPTKMIQFFNKLLLNIYWIEKERIQSQRGEKLQNTEDTTIEKQKVQKYGKQKH